MQLHLQRLEALRDLVPVQPRPAPPVVEQRAIDTRTSKRTFIQTRYGVYSLEPVEK